MARLQLLLFVLSAVLCSPTRSASQVPAPSPDPGEIILQAIRSVERGDSSILLKWLAVLGTDPGDLGAAAGARTARPGLPGTPPGAEGFGPGSAARPGLPETTADVEGSEPGSAARAAALGLPEREAALGLAAAAWVTFRYAEAEARLEALLEALPGDAPSVDAFTPFAWILRGEVAASQAHLAAADSAFAHAVALSEGLGLARPRAWGLIRLANVRGRLTGDPEVSARLLAEAEILLDAEDPYLRGQFHCVRAGRDPGGVWTAEDDARAGLAFAREAGVRRLHAACLNVLGSDQLRRGRTDEALATFREEQEEQRAIGDRSGRAATLQWAGYLLFTAGDFGASRAYLLEAVSEGEASGNLSPVAWAYMSLSGIAVGLGDLSGGLDYLDRAQELLEDQGDQWGLATLRGRRAAVALAAGDWDTAREIWESTLMEHQRAGNAVGILATRTGLLELALATGDLEAGDRILAEARQTARDAGMGDWDISFFFHEAELALKRGDGAGAREALERFLLPGQFSVRVYRAQMRYAEALALEDRIPAAARFMEASLDALEAWRSELDAVGLQRYAFQVGEYVPDPDLGVASVLAAMARAGLVEEAFDLAERQRARSLYEKMILADIGRDLQLEESGVAGSLPPNPRPLTSLEVRESLPDSATAVVEFVTGRGGEPTTAFLLTRDRVQGVVLPAVDSLRRDIHLLRTLVESGRPPGPLASKLGKALFQPLVALLPEEISRLVLIPSGALHRIPYDLLEPDSAGPLLGRFDLSVAPSASVLARLWREERAPGTSLLVLGDPTLSEEDGTARGFVRLPGAAREARTVARFGTSAHLHTGAEASEAFLRTAPLQEYGVLHLATHALVDEVSASASYLLLAPGDGEDGLLSPGDVARMPGAPALVVLSGCRTAGGEVVRGEGVQGLTTPFLQVGTRTVVATQWPMDDRSSHRLIRDFYRELANGADVGAALRAAKLAAADRGEPPGVWAAFTAVGDAGARVPAITHPSRSRPVVFLLALGALALGAAGIGWSRRRSGITVQEAEGKGG
jgi:tetratricopeptide (TPR) repeat protein